MTQTYPTINPALTKRSVTELINLSEKTPQTPAPINAIINTFDRLTIAIEIPRQILMMTLSTIVLVIQATINTETTLVTPLHHITPIVILRIRHQSIVTTLVMTHTTKFVINLMSCTQPTHTLFNEKVNPVVTPIFIQFTILFFLYIHLI